MASSAAHLAQHERLATIPFRVKELEKAHEAQDVRLRALEISKAQLVGVVLAVAGMGGFAGGIGAVLSKALGG